MSLTIKTIDVSNHPEFDGHQQVIRAEDPSIGFLSFIGVHDTTIGPALGGCRFWTRYDSEDDALTDVMRLSRGMTYKNALAQLPLGGGKAVIVGAEGAERPTDEHLRALGQAVESLKGTYITAEDVGMSVAFMQIINEVTDHVTGLPQNDESVAGADPSPFTSYGTLRGVEAAVKVKLGKDSVEGVSVAIAGMGNVGMGLAKLLHARGAKLFVCDIRENKVQEAVEKFGATAIAIEDFMSADVDVLAPCALGGIINDETIDLIKAPIVAGAANNQLARPEHGKMLQDKGILYAPDYVINAGGVISIAMTGEKIETVNKRLDELKATLIDIFTISQQRNKPTAQVADEMAQTILEQAAKAKKPDAKVQAAQ